MPVPSVISMAYWSEARVEGGVQVNEVPDWPEVMTWTVFRLLLGPFFRVRVTGP